MLYTTQVGGISNDNDNGEVVVLPENLQYGLPMSRLELHKTDPTSPDVEASSPEFGSAQTAQTAQTASDVQEGAFGSATPATFQNPQRLQSQSHGQRGDSVAQKALQGWVSSFAFILCSCTLVDIACSNRVRRSGRSKKHNKYSIHINLCSVSSSQMLPLEPWMHRGAFSFQRGQPYLVNQ